MSKNPATAMDVDTPVGTLKRCSSAPMINENSSGVSALPAANATVREQHAFNLFGASSNSQTRTRRFSASFSPISGGSPVSMSGLRLTPRISQLRQEENADISNSRELAHEREIHNTMQISQSWEDLSLMPDSTTDHQKPNNNKMGLLHVSLPAYSFNCSSPSPTRGFQSPTRSRTIIRRSASPVLKPSPLGVKRKLDDDKLEFQVGPRAKRLHSYGSIDRGGLLTTATGSLSSVGTPESLSSADSPGFAFRMVDSPSPNHLQQGEAMIVVSKTDHDMAESPS